VCYVLLGTAFTACGYIQGSIAASVVPGGFPHQQLTVLLVGLSAVSNSVERHLWSLPFLT
jgi:hypothetical protein